jgi:hypothetical protein
VYDANSSNSAFERQKGDGTALARPACNPTGLHPSPRTIMIPIEFSEQKNAPQ